MSDDSISNRSDALESGSEFDSKIALTPDHSPLLVKEKSKNSDKPKVNPFDGMDDLSEAEGISDKDLLEDDKK